MLKAWSSIWNTAVGGGTLTRWRSIGRLLLVLLCMCACMNICVCVHTHGRGRVFKGILRSFFSLFSVSSLPWEDQTSPPIYSCYRFCAITLLKQQRPMTVNWNLQSNESHHTKPLLYVVVIVSHSNAKLANTGTLLELVVALALLSIIGLFLCV